jgi:hypothetical protein
MRHQIETEKQAEKNTGWDEVISLFSELKAIEMYCCVSTNLR